MADPAQGMLENLKLSIPDLSKLPVSSEFKKMDQTASQFFDHLPAMTFNIILAIGLIVVGWVVCGWLASWMNRFLLKAHMEETLAAFLASTARFVVFFSIFIAAITMMGVSSTTMAALVGAMVVAIGFALRGTLGSIAGGIMLMVHRPLKVGDFIENIAPQGTISGTVKRIGLFSTEVNTLEFIRVFIPNVMLWETVLQNHTYNRMRMLKVEFGLGHETDVWQAFGVIKRAASANPLVLKTPDPHLSTDSLGEFGIHCTLEVWVRTEDRKVLKSTILMDIMDALREEGIRMMYQEKEHHEIYGIRATERKKVLAEDAKDDKLPSIAAETPKASQ